jgi:protein SCO1/2
MNLRAAVFVLVLAALGAPAAAEPVGALPGDSIYQLDVTLVDQRSAAFRLDSLRGRPQLVTMFYTSCRYVCPLIIDTLKSIERALTDEERERLGIVVVSFDPERDDVAALASVAAKRKLDPQRWHLTRTDASHVRELAAVLDIQYRRLDDGEFNHASVVTLLDADGRIVARTARVGSVVDDEFVAAVRKQLAASR